MILKHWTHRFLDFCFPGACAACDMPLEVRRTLCPTCHQALEHLEQRPACLGCGRPVGYPGAPCPACQGYGLRPFDTVVRLGTFEDPLRRIILRMKYHHRWHLADLLADRLLEQPVVADLLSRIDVLCPVPLHPVRHMARGFNQAQLIAQRLGRRCGIPVQQPLVRVRNTASQTYLTSRKARIDNLRDAFALDRPGQVASKRVGLVDDVLTTGTTVRSAVRPLLGNKPQNVSLIVVAVADPSGRGFERI